MTDDALTEEGRTVLEESGGQDLARAVREKYPTEIAELMVGLPTADEPVVFRALPRERMADVFAELPAANQENLLRAMSDEERRQLVNDMSPDDRARLLDSLSATLGDELLERLDPEQRQATWLLMSYPQDSAGRQMTPEYLRLRPDMRVADAIEHIRRAPVRTETLNVLYVVDAEGKLVSEVRLATLVQAAHDQRVDALETRPMVAVQATARTDEVVALFERTDRVALPVVDEAGHMLGIVTMDDAMDAARKEATEDVHKIGGSEALPGTYHQVGVLQMIQKRGGWLTVLFLGQMLTASVMGYFEDQIAAASVLALFVPLIISSGGNSGSQAATLVIRSLALGELRLRDWWRVLGREIASGAALGGFLAVLGFARILLWQQTGWADYGEHHALIGMVILVSVVGVVCFGTISGSMLPFALRGLGLDPATSSAPFVATLVDVVGVSIYFAAALAILSGTIL